MFVRETDPVGLFIIEMKIKDNHLQSILRKLGFLFFISFPPVGCKGGLAFCQWPELAFDVIHSFGNILHLLIRPGVDRLDFLCSSVYKPTL